MSLLDAVDSLRQGKPLRERSFVITFDDGFQTVFSEAFPVLQQYGMLATVFLTVGEKKMLNPDDRLPSLNNRSMLSWREMGEMQRCGIDFGSHTLTHPDLRCLSFECIKSEVCNSKAMIEDTLGIPVNCFSYPFGCYDHRSREIVKRYFACACSDKLGLINASSDLYALERVDAYYLRSDLLFDVMLTRLFPWYIRARSIPRLIQRAIQLRLM